MALAALICATALRALFPLAARLGLVDQPLEGRKHHGEAVPVIGGLAIFSAILVVSILAGYTSEQFVYGLTGAALLVFVGVIDDRFTLGASARFLAQIGAALLLVVGAGVELSSLGDLVGLGDIELGALSVPVTVFAMVGLINAMNMIDGIDGLAGGVALIACVSLMLLAPSTEVLRFLMLITIAALLPFLIDNLQLLGRHDRRVFLGDSGSMLLGYLVVWGLVDAATATPGIAPVTALWLIALPLMDTFRVMILRVRRGVSPLAADATHVHYIVTELLGGDRRALVALLAGATLFATVGIVSSEYAIQESVMFFWALGAFAVHLILTHVAGKWCRRTGSRSVAAEPLAE